ncbi:tail fiber protein [Dickeya undicola]|uniref:Phage tail protein n=1 Tax=Dickeya undicola TaxID=1577887 RepID=A0A3N0G6C7_9GAMM|nr:tail fiber protein [Dickeya undicola]RNM07690.1 phage tail protein [Dickeya undicola]
MEQKFFRVPFAASGDRQSIPDAADHNGYVSFTNGWGGDYAKDPAADANAKPVEREAMNAILYAITVAVRQYQTVGFPEWITPANNGGVAYQYERGAVVRYRSAQNQPFESYVSIVDGNASTPGADANWQPFIYRESTPEEAADDTNGTTLITPRRLHPVIDAEIQTLQQTLLPFLLPVGFCGIWFQPTPPDGWLEANGQSFDVNEYPKLAARFPSGRVPDMRGRFARGWAHGSAVDPDSGREIGSVQGDALQNITGSFIADIVNTDNAGRGVSGAFADAGGVGSGDSGDQGAPELRQYSFDASRVARTSIETRPTNLAVMYIIKTDKAVSDAGVAGPAAIVVTPNSATMNAGSSKTFVATVLPANLAAEYPVAWSVSDASLGSIDQNGNYSATAGKTGIQTIIASIATGLTATIKVSQYVYLTSIAVSAVPDIMAGNSYTLGITAVPAGFSEPLDYSSSDAQIGSVANGTVTGIAAGTITGSVTGRYSGVTASFQVKITPEVVVETYLKIANNLSEIETAGASSQLSARTHLGLGTLSTKNALSASDVGAFPQRATALTNENLNSLTSPGVYRQPLSSSATSALNYPAQLAGALVVYPTNDSGCRQVYMPYNNTLRYERYTSDGVTWPASWSLTTGSALTVMPGWTLQSLTMDNIAHGITDLDVNTATVETFLRCKTAVDGYAVGDYAVNPVMISLQGSALISVPLGIQVTTSVVRYRIPNLLGSGAGIAYSAISNSFVISQNLSNWEIIVKIRH